MQSILNKIRWAVSENAQAPDDGINNLHPRHGYTPKLSHPGIHGIIFGSFRNGCKTMENNDRVDIGCEQLSGQYGKKYSPQCGVFHVHYENHNLHMPVVGQERLCNQSKRQKPTWLMVDCRADDLLLEKVLHLTGYVYY
jgi:hypothetical protein